MKQIKFPNADFFRDLEKKAIALNSEIKILWEKCDNEEIDCDEAIHQASSKGSC